MVVVAGAALALLAAFLQPPDGRHLGFAIPSVTEPVLLTLAAVRALLVALHASGATWAPVPPDWLTALTAFLVLAIYIALGHRRLRRGRDQGASSPVEEEYEEEPVTDRSRVSVRFPRRLVKGHSATFLVQIYPPFRSRTAQRHAAALFGDVETTGADGRGIIQSGAAEVALSCPAMRFAAPVRLLLKREGADLAFWGQPADTAQPGPHAGLLTIRDPVTGDQQFSLPFTVIVVDYAFGRVSRLAVNRVAAGALGALSVAGFAFGLVTQTNQVVGLVAGGVSAALSAFMTARMTSVYRRPGVTAGDQTDAP
ncbi:MAG: hypothetical protein HOY71_28820 [Nonomuraea sp.]|nr:hypothetical protein [Nonomuraea sp.]